MKKTVLTLISLFFLFSLFSQNAVPNAATLARFKKSTTYVVFDQSMFGTAYNEKIQEAMKIHWKITPYEFITRDKYLQMLANPNSSFIAKTQVSFKNDKQRIPYDFLNLMMGTVTSNVTLMPDIANFPLSYAGASDENYSYKLGMILIFMQNHIKVLEENPDLNEKTILKYYNKNTTQIHDKTLYVLKEDLSAAVNTLAKIKAIYPYNVEIVDKYAIEKAINDSLENIVFFHVVKPEVSSSKKERCYKIIMGASDARIYYWSMDKITEKKPDGILTDDFKSLK